MSRLRHLWRRLRGTGLKVVWRADESLRLAGLPMDPRRGDRIMAFLSEERLVRPSDIGRPLPASVEALLRVHDPRWIEALDDVTLVSAALGTPVNEDERRDAVAVQRLHAGGTVLAARVAWRQGGLVAHLGGGLHHATSNRGMAFCLINDIAIAIRHLRHYGCTDPILVIDLDLHDGNGTRAAFAADPTVFTLSIHNTDWDPPGGVATQSVALGTGVDDGRYLAAVRDTLPGILAAHRPRMVFYVAGVDPAADDRLGDWRITAGGMLARDQVVIETLRGLDPRLPIVTLLAGGYGAGAWRYTARFLAWVATGKHIEPVADLKHAVRRLRAAGAMPANDWGLTEDDLFAAGAPRSQRVLERFSPLIIELSLERAGILGAMRAAGFSRPVVVSDTSSPVGDTIRVFTNPDRIELLLELRIARSRTVIPGMEVLAAEWLRLQNPRVSFSDTSPRLPGQDHPGLGLLREVVAWVVLLCETLGLDGLVFTPAQYYMAAIAQHHMRFLTRDGASRFAAVDRAVGGRPLAEAEAYLAGHGIAWEGAAVQMVYPVSDRLRALLQQREQDALGEPDHEPGNKR